MGKLCLLIGFCILPCLLQAAEVAEKPNIIFFLADDLGHADTGYTGANGFAVADTTVSKPYPELVNKQVSYQEVAGIGYEEGVTRRDPSDIIRVEDTYYVYYTKVVHADVAEDMLHMKGSGYVGTLWYATSKDEGQSWMEEGQALGLGKPGTFDSFATFTPNIVKFNGKYYLYYTGVKPTTPDRFFFEGNSTTDQTAIGVAVSESPDGPFERVSDEPVLKPRPGSTDKDVRSPFDSFRVDDAALMVRDHDGDGDLDVWLYYKGRNIDHVDHGSGKTQTGLAVADTPESEHARVNNGKPILPRNHEVMIWPHREGVVAYQSMTRTLEYAPDGIDFMAKPLMEPAPAEPRLAAPGCFRLDLTEPVEFGEGISWGIAARDQNAIRDKGKRTPYLARYEVDLVVSER